MRRLKFVVLVLAFILSGCRNNDDSKTPFTGSYNVYSNGTSAGEIREIPTEETSASFYIPKGMVTRFASKNLSDEELEAYNTIVNQMGQFEETVPMIVNSEAYSKLLDIIRVEQLSYFHVTDRRSGGYDTDIQKFTVVFSYRLSAKEITEMNLEVEKAADKIIEGITGDMTDYDKLKYLHDYLIKSCDSDTTDEFADSIYGALIRKKAHCEGYSKAFSYLCNRIGVENTIVTGMTTDYHMWNMVKLDGNWYHVDVTWDKPNDTAINQMYPDTVLYQYFMVNDAVIENDHTIFNKFVTPPRANSTKENYFLKEKRYVSSADDFLAIAESALIDAVEKKESTAMIKFDSTDIYLSCVRKLEDDKVFDEAARLKDVVDNIQRDFGVNLKVSFSQSYSVYRILLFVIEYS